MQNTELRVRIRPRGSVGGRRWDDLHARTGVRYDADRCRCSMRCCDSEQFLSSLLSPYSHFLPSNKFVHFLLVRSLTTIGCNLRLFRLLLSNTIRKNYVWKHIWKLWDKCRDRHVKNHTKIHLKAIIVPATQNMMQCRILIVLQIQFE